MKNASLLFLCLMFTFSACASFTPTISEKNATVSPTNTITTVTQTSEIPSEKTTTPETSWFLYYQYEFADNFWKVGQHQYQIIVDCVNENYLPSREFTPISFTVDENLRLLEGGIIVFSYDKVWLHYQGLGTTGMFHPKQKTKVEIGYGGLISSQASEAAKKCAVRAVFDDNLTVQLLASEPTLKPRGGAVPIFP